MPALFFGAGHASILLFAIGTVTPWAAAAESQPVTAEGAVRSAERLQKPTTPIAKVIDLLKGLSKKVTDAGKEEAVSYDKFACFCKEQADEKLYAIEKSNQTTAEASVKIEELSAEVDALAAAISDLSKLIDEKEGDVAKLEEARNSSHSVYKDSEAELVQVMDAVDRAIAALQESKADATGKAASALMQVREVVLRARLLDISASQASVLAAQPKDYQYHSGSNDIIETLKGLKDTFRAQKERLDKDEIEAKSVFEKQQLGLKNEAKFAGMDRDQKQKREAKAQEEKAAADELLAQETQAKKADNEFLTALTAECEEKAEFWDQRSRTRAGELTAISQALELLESGAKPNAPQAGVNPALTNLQTKQMVKKIVVVASAPSFLQLRGAAAGAKRAELLRFLDVTSQRLGGGTLELLALKVRSLQDPGVDHFVKVRRLIEDLVTKLENEAKEEQTQKDFCDKEIEKAVAARDAASSDKEVFSQELAAKEANSNELKANIAELAEQIAANKKALLEATELRGEEKAENEKTIADSKAGKEAVSQAIEVLKTFYDNAGSLLQKRSAYTPPNSDRSGATVADLAPKVFDENYAGDQDGAKGILGMLEVIRDDFERTEIQTGNEESEAAKDFDDFKSELDLDTKGKKGEVETSKSTVADLKERLVELKEDLSEAKKELEASLGELQTLKEACVESAETHEERTEKRQQEVEGLKQALDILENFKGL